MKHSVGVKVPVLALPPHYEVINGVDLRIYLSPPHAERLPQITAWCLHSRTLLTERLAAADTKCCDVLSSQKRSPDTYLPPAVSDGDRHLGLSHLGSRSETFAQL